MDMDGKVLHTWRHHFEDIWPGWKVPHIRGLIGKQTRFYWRNVHLLPNGDLLAIFDYRGLIKINKDSKLLWAHRGSEHHDLDIADDGNIYVLSQEERILPRINNGKPILDDLIIVLDAEGNEIRSISIMECFWNSNYAGELDDAVMYKNFRKHRKVLYANSLELFDGKLAYKSTLFRKGNALISLRRLNAIAIVDLEKETIVWKLSHLWRKQHAPTLLDNGNILIFDNLYNKKKLSRVLEINPFTQEIMWEYVDENKKFFSAGLGSQHRLPNGNTLIIESMRGRAFEVTRDHQIAWEFFNPHRASKNNELIATIPEMVRLSPNFPLDWLKEDAVE